MAPLLAWFHDHAPERGFRIPTTLERTRATGRANYLCALGLNEVQLFNAVGNHFDPDALRARIIGPLRRMTTAQHSQHLYPAPADLAVMYRALADQVAQDGTPHSSGPIPA